MKLINKIMAAMLICALLFSLASCKADPEEVSAAADTYAKCVQFLDADRIFENTEAVEDSKKAAFKEKLTLADKDYDQAKVKDVIAKSITYTVNSDTMVTARNSATINILFSRKNYDAILSGVKGNSEAFLEALNNSSDQIVYTVNIKFNKQEDGRWLAEADTIDKLNDLYSFLDKKFEFKPDIPDLFDSTSWLFTKENRYENAKCIELDVWFKENPNQEFYYVVSKDGTEIYKSEPSVTTDIFYRAKFDKSLGAKTTSQGYITQGLYNIKVYRTEDNYLTANETAVVIVNGTKGAPEITKAPTGASYSIKDPSFASIKSLGWWDYSATLLSDGIYCINTRTLAFSIELLSDAEPVYYAYYFVPGEKADLKKIDYSKPVYSNTIEQYIYIDGSAYFNFDYEPPKMEVGTYLLVIAKDKDSVDKPYITAKVKIIPQSSEEFI